MKKIASFLAGLSVISMTTTAALAGGQVIVSTERTVDTPIYVAPASGIWIGVAAAILLGIALSSGEHLGNNE